MVDNRGFVVVLPEEGQDDLVWILLPGFHGLLELRHQIHEFAHGECDRVIREGFPNRIHLCSGYCVACGWCYILAHPLDVRRVGLGHPFLGCLSYFILLLPFYYLCLAPRCDLLHFDRDNVHG